MTYLPGIGKTNLDSFGRLRTSHPHTLFDSKQLVDNQPLHWDDVATAGSGTSSTYNANQASTTLGVSNSTAGTRVRQTKRYWNYQPGKSQLAFLTFVFGAAASGITRRVGLFDNGNGIYLEQNGTDVRFVVRSSTTGSPVNTNYVVQANWNNDTLSALDLTKTQILVIDFEWLGVGTVRVGFVIDGQIRYVHAFNHANSTTIVYMSQPNLPIRYEISNTGAGGAASMTCICSTVITEGGRSGSGIVRGIDRLGTALTTGNDTSIYPLLAIRLGSSYLMASVRQLSLSVILTTGTNAWRWALILNPTIVGTALSFTALTNSPVEYQRNTTNATTITADTGTRLVSGYANGSSTGILNMDVDSDLQLGSTIAGVSDVLVLAVQRVSGTGACDFFGAMNWREEI